MINTAYLVFALAVAVAGGIGAVLRHALRNLQGWLPWGTLLANVGASALAAVAFVALAPSSLGEVSLVAGLAGGLSTFSTFASQLHAMLLQRAWLRALVYSVLSFGVSSTVVALVAMFS